MTSRVCREFLFERTVIVMSAEGGFQTRPYGYGSGAAVGGEMEDFLAEIVGGAL